MTTPVAIEDDFRTRMIGSTTLMAILTGGVHVSGTVGPLGITRETTPSAFDANGWLKPCALVKQAGNIPTFDVQDHDSQLVSARQRVEIWLYQDRGYTAIDAAYALIYALFQGKPVGDTFEAVLVNDIDRQRDMGALAGASMRRLDFQLDSIIGE